MIEGGHAEIDALAEKGALREDADRLWATLQHFFLIWAPLSFMPLLEQEALGGSLLDEAILERWVTANVELLRGGALSMSRWETTSTLEADVSPAAVWERAYANAEAWPKWNAEIKRASLDGPLTLDAKAKIVFGTGLRLRFRVVEFEEGRLFTDESRLPGARMGHRHLIEPTENGGSA